MASQKQKIYIYISDVASFVGQNKWDYVTPFEQLWKRCNTATYNSLLQKIQSTIAAKKLEITQLDSKKQVLDDDLMHKRITKRQHTIAINKLLKEKETVHSVVNKLENRVDDIDLTQQQKLEKALSTVLVADMQSSTIETDDKKTIINKAVDNLNISEEQKQDVRKYAESYINKTHGTLKENDAITMFETKFNTKLDTSQQLLKKRLDDLSLHTPYDWYICGKVDGLYIDNSDPEKSYVVEVKNRTKGFFTTLRDYEKTQIQLYLWILDLKHAKLVEKYKNELRITAIFKDQDYINDIQKYMSIFINNFSNSFLSNDDAKIDFMSRTADDKKLFLNKLYINDIYQSYADNHDTGPAQDCLIDDL
jgi:hypothetical protein